MVRDDLPQVDIGVELGDRLVIEEESAHTAGRDLEPAPLVGMGKAGFIDQPIEQPLFPVKEEQTHQFGVHRLLAGEHRLKRLGGRIVGLDQLKLDRVVKGEGVLRTVSDKPQLCRVDHSSCTSLRSVSVNSTA